MLIKPQVDELALWMLTVQPQEATAAAGIPAWRGADNTLDRASDMRPESPSLSLSVLDEFWVGSSKT